MRLGAEMMLGNLSDIIKIPVALILGMAISAGFLVLFYEGVSLPLVGHVIDGRVQSEVSAATAAADAKCEAKLDKTVSNFAYETLNAQLLEERRQRSDATRLTDQYRKLAEAAQANEAEANQRLENAIADDNAKPSEPGDDGGYHWTDDDLEWLRLHREGTSTPGRAGTK